MILGPFEKITFFGPDPLTRRNEHDNVICVVGIGQDITAHLAHEREYSTLFDNT
jgi:hypothetical protein